MYELLAWSAVTGTVDAPVIAESDALGGKRFLRYGAKDALRLDFVSSRPKEDPALTASINPMSLLTGTSSAEGT